MDEHDDDLASKVDDGARLETDAYPDTGDELDEQVSSSQQEEPPDPDLDDDKAEL